MSNKTMIFATDDQKTNLSIRSSQKTWSVFAEAFDAEARYFGTTTPKFQPIAIINWHLNYEGPKCTSMQTELLAHSTEGLDLDQDSLVLVPELSIGQDLDQDPLVLVPVPPGLDVAAHNVVSGSLASTRRGHFPRHAGEDFHAHTHTHRWQQNIPALGCERGIMPRLYMHSAPYYTRIIHQLYTENTLYY